MPAYTTPPSQDDMLTMAEAALAAMPPVLASQVSGVSIVIEDQASDDILDKMDIEHPWELTGLYQGHPRPGRSVMDVAPLPDRITLYREAILVEWIETGEDLPTLIASVLVHEIAHHFGFSDEDIARIERETDGRAP
jgi:predicted Zn-dependent protease with MMP-like domain